LSAIPNNNLTATIVMMSLLRKLIPNDEDRRLFGAMVVVAANARGVTPRGDVTTTMLWINNQLSTLPTVTQLFLLKVVCLVASMAVIVNQVEEDASLAQSTLPPSSPLATRGQVVF